MLACEVLHRRDVCDFQRSDLVGLVRVELAARNAEEDILGVGNLVVHNPVVDILAALAVRGLGLEADTDWVGEVVRRVRRIGEGLAVRLFCRRLLELVRTLVSERRQV